MKNLFLITLLVFGISAQAQIPTDGQMGYYPFNGNANDESGNGYHGIVNGATLTMDRFGNSDAAYSFDETNFIELSNTADLHMYSGFSLVAWVNYTDNSGGGDGGGSVVSKHENYWVNGFGMGIATNNKANISIHPLDYVLETSETYNDGEWHLLVGIYDGNQIHIYVDSVLDGSLSALYTIGNTINIFIGKDSALAYYNGIIDDVGIYNRPLTQDEINDIFHDGGWLGINDFNDKSINIYPNPVNDILNIRAEEIINSVSISNVLGQKMYYSSVDTSGTTIDISAYSIGTYFVKVQIGDSVIKKKFLKE